MYVKLRFRTGHESLYQCDRFFINPTTGSFTHADITLESNHPEGCVSIGSLDRTQLDIFVMNDQGKTIETYWAAVAPAPPPTYPAA